MRHVRQHQRIISLQNNKENEQSVNNQNLNTHLNLPFLRHSKLLSSKEYHLNIQPRKKTFLNLCVKKSVVGNEKNSMLLKKPL
jgi:hypothetical protein